jgi:Fe-S-cluster containining protein
MTGIEPIAAERSMMNFICKRCGKCCGIAPFSKEDYKAAKKEIARLGVRMVKENVSGRQVYFSEKNHNDLKKLSLLGITRDKLIERIVCPFLQSGGEANSVTGQKILACKLYDKRPMVCREFGINPKVPCPFQKGV